MYYLCQNTWHQQLVFPGSCFYPTQSGHTAIVKSHYQYTEYHSSTKFHSLAWRWYFLDKNIPHHSPTNDKRQWHLRYPILHRTLLPRSRNSRLQLGLHSRFVHRPNELKKLKFIVMYCDRAGGGMITMNFRHDHNASVKTVKNVMNKCFPL